MNFGFRYHVASLMAVFFSLILGILIGGALFPDHVLVDEQATVITELEERFRKSQASLAEVEEELEVARMAWAQFLDAVSKDLLTAKTVVLVDDGQMDISFLGTALQLAGAEVQTVQPALLETAVGTDLPEEITFVFSLSGDTLVAELQELWNELATSGARLAFVWDTSNEPALSDLPKSLKIDSIDTAMGQLAFLVGLARGSEGHFGRQMGAQGLFPCEL